MLSKASRLEHIVMALPKVVSCDLERVATSSTSAHAVTIRKLHTDSSSKCILLR